MKANRAALSSCESHKLSRSPNPREKHFEHEINCEKDSSEKTNITGQQNFIPPKIRRNIAILGLIHKRDIGKRQPNFGLPLGVICGALLGIWFDIASCRTLLWPQRTNIASVTFAQFYVFMMGRFATICFFLPYCLNKVMTSRCEVVNII